MGNAISKKRIDYIDIAKGFAILLVIIGHCSISPITRCIIYSFHMPFFFIVSSITFRLSENNDQFVKKTEKAFIHLVMPAVGIYFFWTVINSALRLPLLITYNANDLKNYFANIINVLVAGSGVDIKIGDATIGAFSIPWFLLVLFFGRTLFDYLHLKIRKKALFYLTIAFFSVIGIFLGYVQWLPCSLDIAFAIQPLFLSGHFIKKLNEESSKIRMSKDAFVLCIISLFVWIGTLILIYFVTGSYIELAYRRYSAYPLCFISAIAGTLFLCSFSQLLSDLNRTLCYPPPNIRNKFS